MKICLIPFPVFRESADPHSRRQLSPYLPLGLLTLSSLLEQAGHKVVILDPVWSTGSNASSEAKVYLPDSKEFALRVKAENPDLVGFSTNFSSYPIVLKWAKLFSKVSPQTPILFGGPQASACAEKTLEAFPWVNMVLRGEAEKCVISLVNCLQTNGNLGSVPGLTWRIGTQIIRNDDAAVVTDLNTLPVPAYHLYPFERLIQHYAKTGYLNHHNFSVEAGRGCPFKCSFCSTGSFFKRGYRAKSVDSVVLEMVKLQENYGVANFTLGDDLFTCNRTNVAEFCHTLCEKGLQKKISWECYARIDTVDHDILTQMVAAGCSGIFYGIETGSPRLQKLIGKNLSIDNVKKTVKETLSLGINVYLGFICGFPQECREDLSATINLAIDLMRMGVKQIAFLPLVPLPLTELYLKFGATLQYDASWASDMPYGWVNREFKKQILKRPDVFTGFYNYETPDLNYDVRQILFRVFNSFPRLLAVLAASNVDVFSVFESWAIWRNAQKKGKTRAYYSQKRLFSDFFRFLSQYLRNTGLMTPQLNDIIRFHAAIDRAANGSETMGIISKNFRYDVPTLLTASVKGYPSANEVADPVTYVFLKVEGNVKAERVTPSLSGLLDLIRPQGLN